MINSWKAKIRNANLISVRIFAMLQEKLRGVIKGTNVNDHN